MDFDARRNSRISEPDRFIRVRPRFTACPIKTDRFANAFTHALVSRPLTEWRGPEENPIFRRKTRNRNRFYTVRRRRPPQSFIAVNAARVAPASARELTHDHNTVRIYQTVKSLSSSVISSACIYRMNSSARNGKFKAE